MTNRSRIGLESQLVGKTFESDIASAWSKVPFSWRMRIKDGGGSERPADDLVLLSTLRLLCELKTTKFNKFNYLKLVKDHQTTGLLAFDRCNPDNFGIFVIYFSKFEECYVVRAEALLEYIRFINKFSIPRDAFYLKRFRCLSIEKLNDEWDLSNIEERLLLWK